MSTWYEPDGLQFECTMCGACCSGGEGFVLFTDAEAEAIARRLKLAVPEFLARHTHMTEAGRSLKEIQTEHGLDCVFLDRSTIPGKAVCSLYEDRPTQCRTFPFWPEHIESRRAWQRLSKHCEGINRGSFVPVESIRIHRDLQRGVDLGRPG
jgi:Fe-S-cluster containining protein